MMIMIWIKFHNHDHQDARGGWMTPVDQARRRFSLTLRHTGVLLAVVATLVLAACSSSNSSSSSSSGTASSGSSSSSSSRLSSADHAGPATAEALVTPQTQRPTTITHTTTGTKPIPKRLTIDLIPY